MRFLLWTGLYALLGCPASHSAQVSGTVQGTVILEPMKPAPLPPGYRVQTKKQIKPPDDPQAVVYLEREDGEYPKVASDRELAVGQEGYQFRPGVAVVRTGSQVSFPNRDDEFHNVFSYSRAKRFDLGRFRKDEVSPRITFDKPGLVRVYCEIHKHMRSMLLVLDTPWFTTTDAQGRFSLRNIPPGEYRIKAFLPSEKTLESRIRIDEGKTISINLPR